MHRKLSAEDAAFQQRMRDFFTHQVPAELRQGPSRRELSPEDQRTAQRLLNSTDWPYRPGHSSGADRTGPPCSTTSSARRCSWPGSRCHWPST